MAAWRQHRAAHTPAFLILLRRTLCVPQVERVAKSGGPLYKNFTSGQALTYLDGTLPGGAWLWQLVQGPGAGPMQEQL